jgi:hypothetical protein
MHPEVSILIWILFRSQKIRDLSEKMLGHRLTTKQTAESGVLVRKVRTWHEQ